MDYKNSKPAGLPEVKISKNGYEIRADLVSAAKDWLIAEYNFKLGEYENSVSVTDGKLVHKVNYPAPPTLNEIIEVAEQFLCFVQKK